MLLFTPSSTFPHRLAWATTLAVCLSLGACSDPPKAVVPTPAPVESSSWVQLQEASKLEAGARGLPPHKADEALGLAYRTLEIRRRLLGDGHQDTWRTAELISSLHLEANQLDQAESALQFDLAARERTLGSASAELARPLGMLADLAVKRRNYPLAEQLRRRTLTVLEAGLGPWHPDVALGGIRLATLLLDLCRSSEAEPLLQRALEIQVRAFGATSPDLADTWQHLAKAHWIAGDQATAESNLQKSVALLSPYEKDRAESLMEALDRLARTYHARSLSNEARSTRERAVDIGVRYLGASKAATVNAVASLWSLYRITGNAEAAEKLLSRAAIARIERTRQGAVAPDPLPPTTPAGECAPPAAPSTGTATSGGNVANAAEVVRSMSSGFRRCYNNGLKVDRNLTGSVRITARIAARGEVSSVSAFVQVGTMMQVGECLLDVVMQSQFSPPEGGGATIIIPATFVAQ